MFQFDKLINILSDNFFLLIFALTINIGITYLRCLRLRNFITIKDIKGVFLFLSFYRVANFTLPFKSADIIQFFFLKKILIKNKILNILSILTLTKVIDMIFVQVIASLIFITFVLDKINSFIFLLFLFLVIAYILKKKKIIVKYIKKIKKKLKNIKNINKLFIIIFKEIDYLFRKDLLKKSIMISFLNYIFILVILYLSTDQTLDREIFFLVFIFSILQPIPLRIFFGIGFFDVAVYVSNLYFGIGINIEQLLLFRVLQFTLLIMEFVILLIYNIFNLAYVIFKKYNSKIM
jgi:hypothetical protein